MRFVSNYSTPLVPSKADLSDIRRVFNYYKIEHSAENGNEIEENLNALQDTFEYFNAQYCDIISSNKRTYRFSNNTLIECFIDICEKSHIPARKIQAEHRALTMKKREEDGNKSDE